MIRYVIGLIKDIFNKGFFHLLSANVVMSFISFASQLLVAKFLTPLELGQIKTIQSFIGFFTIIACFGLNHSILKLCSEKRSLEQKQTIFKKNVKYSFWPTLFTLILIYILAKLNYFSPDKVVNQWIVVFMFIIPSGNYSTYVINYFLALKKIKLMAKIQVFIRLLGIILIVVLTYYYGLAGFIFSLVLHGYICLVPLIYMVRKDLFVKSVPLEKEFFKINLSFAGWMLAAQILSTAAHFMDIFMLNFLITDRVAFGYYSFATVFIMGMNYITQTIDSIATPYFSEKSTDYKEFRRVLVKYEKLIIPFSALVMVAGIIFLPLFLGFFYGEKYKDVSPYFNILSLKYFIWSCYVLYINAMYGIRKMDIIFYVTCSSLVVSMVSSYFLILKFGVFGAAYAQVLTFSFSGIATITMTNITIKKYFKNLSQENQSVEDFKL